MRFKVDENLPVEVAQFLTEAGHIADTTAEEGLAGQDDELVARHCREDGRALVTLDLDFGDIRAYPPAEHPGIVILRPRRQDKQSVVRLVRRLVTLLPSDSLNGRIWIVETDRVRMR